MGFLKTGLACLTIKAFTFSGRSSRYEYWSMLVTAMFFSFFLSVMLGFFLAPVLGSVFKSSKSLVYTMSLPLFVFLIASISLSCRRLHDLGYSGWLYPILTVCVVGFGMLFVASSSDSGIIHDLVGIVYIFFSVLQFIMFMAMMFRKGESGGNKYGFEPVK